MYLCTLDDGAQNIEQTSHNRWSRINAGVLQSICERKHQMYVALLKAVYSCRKITINKRNNFCMKQCRLIPDLGQVFNAGRFPPAKIGVVEGFQEKTDDCNTSNTLFWVRKIRFGNGCKYDRANGYTTWYQ